MEQLDIFTGSERDPRQYVYDALEWAAKDYPYRWMKFINLIESEVAAGNKRIRRGDVYALARSNGFSIAEADELFRQDNNIWPGLSRYALMFRPELCAVIYPAEQIWDNLIDFPREWHAVVNPNTFFFFDDWREAKEAYRNGDTSAMLGRGA